MQESLMLSKKTKAKGKTNLRVGDSVRLTEYFKDKMASFGRVHEHVAEFGSCVGTIECITDFGIPNDVHPFVDVRWQPSGLMYAYNVETDLERA